MTPSPNTYKLASCMNPLKTTEFKKQSPRNAFSSNFNPGDRKLSMHSQIPSANHYTYLNKTVGSESVKFTLKPKLYCANRENTPGPGTYETIGIDTKGQYILSNIP